MNTILTIACAVGLGVVIYAGWVLSHAQGGMCCGF